jgi:microsomal dipeptidase-like Zn-dependent dipeptidase
VHLAERLLARGASERDVTKLLGDNMRRVFERATGSGTRAHEVTLPSPMHA